MSIVLLSLDSNGEINIYDYTAGASYYLEVPVKRWTGENCWELRKFTVNAKRNKIWDRLSDEDFLKLSNTVKAFDIEIWTSKYEPYLINRMAKILGAKD